MKKSSCKRSFNPDIKGKEIKSGDIVATFIVEGDNAFGGHLIEDFRVTLNNCGTANITNLTTYFSSGYFQN